MSGLRLLPAESIFDTSANVTLLAAAKVLTDHSLLGQVGKLLSPGKSERRLATKAPPCRSLYGILNIRTSMGFEMLS